MKFALVLSPPNDDEHILLVGYNVRHVLGPFDDTASNDEIVDTCRQAQGGNRPAFSVLIVSGAVLDPDC